jgi:2-oxoisovalerate dehydrogenase E1 component
MNAMLKAKQTVLEKGQPVIVHANCIRIGSHSNSDRQELYRSAEELQEVRMMDPVAKFRKILLYSEKFTEDELVAIEEETAKVISAAHKKVLAAPDPDPASILNFVTAEPYMSVKYPKGLSEGVGPRKKMIEALNETLKAEFRRNPDTFMWGQDMANRDKGGIFNVSKGMQQEFGPKRIFNAPIAEDFIVGTANGMSRFSEKIRIVVEGAEFADYFWPAMEQLVEMSHDYWRSNGQFTANVTIRLAAGGYIGGGLYHSQNIESALSTLPGLRIVYPSFADDAAGLLRTSMRSKGPTVFFEPKALYNDPIAATEVPDDFEVPFGKARIRRKGDRLTVVAYGNTTHMCLRVAEKIAKEDNIQIEVIDIRSIVPLDTETILKSVEKTSRAMVVHEDKLFSGFGGEIAATIQEKAFRFLDAPVGRVGSTYTPVGFNRILEKAILPNDDKIHKAIKEILSY